MNNELVSGSKGGIITAYHIDNHVDPLERLTCKVNLQSSKQKRKIQRLPYHSGRHQLRKVIGDPWMGKENMYGSDGTVCFPAGPEPDVVADLTYFLGLRGDCELVACWLGVEWLRGGSLEGRI